MSALARPYLCLFGLLDLQTAMVSIRRYENKHAMTRAMREVPEAQFYAATPQEYSMLLVQANMGAIRYGARGLPVLEVSQGAQQIDIRIDVARGTNRRHTQETGG